MKSILQNCLIGDHDGEHVFTLITWRPKYVGRCTLVYCQSQGGRRDTEGRTTFNSDPGFSSDTWKLGHTLRDEGNLRCMAKGFALQSTSKGIMKPVCGSLLGGEHSRRARPFGLPDQKGLELFFVWPASGIYRSSKGGMHEHATKCISNIAGWLAKMVPQPPPSGTVIMGMVPQGHINRNISVEANIGNSGHQVWYPEERFTIASSMQEKAFQTWDV